VIEPGPIAEREHFGVDFLRGEVPFIGLREDIIIDEVDPEVVEGEFEGTGDREIGGEFDADGEVRTFVSRHHGGADCEEKQKWQ